MILFTANGRCARCLTDEKITTGSVGIEVRFDLSAEFEDLAAIAVFEAAGVSADVVLTGDSCTVPAGVLETPFVPLRIGVYARDGGGTVVIPTVWAEAGTIRPGATPGTVDPTEPIPDWTAQVQKNATDAMAKSEEAMETAEEALHKTDQALTDAERYAANAKRSAEAAAESSGEASISADAAWYHRTQAEAAAAEAAGSATAAAGSATAAAGSAGEAAGSAEEAAASAAEAQRIEEALEPLDGLPGRVSTLEEELGFALYPAWVQGAYTSNGYQAGSAGRKRTDKLPAGKYSAAISTDFVLTVVRYISDTKGETITKTESGDRYYFESDGPFFLNTRRADNTSVAAMTDAEINAIWQLKGEPITDRVAELEEAVDGYGAAAQPAAGTDMVATRSIASGEYFAAGYGLYQATAAIASGETIVPGTNCTQTSSAAALNALRSGKQNQLTFDSTPTEGSSNPVTSGGVADAVAEIDGEVSNLKSSISDSQGNIIPSAELKSAVDAISTVTLGENLANPETVTVGSLTSTGGVDSSATGYKTFDYIALEANTDYTLTSWRMDTGALVTSRKHVALYDSTKAFISGSYQNVNGASSVAFNSGTSAKYARVSVGGTNNAFVAKGSTAPTAFVEYTKTYSTDMIVENYKAGSISSEALSAGLHNELLHKGAINLYEAQSAVVGVLTLTGKVDTTGTNYLTSDFIPIKQGFTYTVSPICRRKCFYSAINMGAFVSADNTQYNAPHSFVAAFTGYLRFSFSNSASDVSCIETFSGTVTEKIEEGVSLSETQKAQVSALIEDTANLGYDVLYGKKWAVCGDSFTNSGGTGTTMPAGAKYAGNPYTYPWIIGSRQNMDIIKFFEGGRTLAFPEEPGTFANSLTNPNATWYYQNIPADVDYITIYLGINDEHHSSASSGGDGEDNTGIIPIGTIDDNTTATYLGAWNVVLTWLITNRPNAHIGIIVTNGIPLKDEYRLGQIAIAQKYGIPYIDLNGDTRTPAMLRTSNPNIPTNIKQALIEKWSANYPSNQHPNDAAQLFESSFIENFLRSI